VLSFLAACAAGALLLSMFMPFFARTSGFDCAKGLMELGKRGNTDKAAFAAFAGLLLFLTAPACLATGLLSILPSPAVRPIAALGAMGTSGMFLVGVFLGLSLFDLRLLEHGEAGFYFALLSGGGLGFLGLLVLASSSARKTGR
jgi:hypothetical protein